MVCGAALFSINRITKDVICHECAPRFGVHLFLRYLEGYSLHQVLQDPDSAPDQGAPMTLSQHVFGWPEHRPRSYCILTKNASCTLTGRGIQVIHELFRKPNLDASHLYCAPQDWARCADCMMVIFLCDLIVPSNDQECFFFQLSFQMPFTSNFQTCFFLMAWKDLVENERHLLAHKQCKPLNSRFEDLLSGSSIKNDFVKHIVWICSASEETSCEVVTIKIEFHCLFCRLKPIDTKVPSVSGSTSTGLPKKFRRPSPNQQNLVIEDPWFHTRLVTASLSDNTLVKKIDNIFFHFRDTWLTWRSVWLS